MFKKDNLFIGMISGMIFPGIAYVLILSNMGNIINNNPFALYALAALLNLLIMRYFSHFKLSKSMQGVILITFIIAMFLLFSGGFRIAT